MQEGPESPTSAETLLAHLDWIRRLARQMVAETDAADDLAQEACVVALHRQPRDATRFRQWIAEVMRNALRERRRGAARRDAREADVARAEAQESTGRIVERVTLQRELVQAVLELEEPFKSAILLRFFENLPPREIASRLGTTVNTVNSRIGRGLERLRERLDRSAGGREPWLLAFAPWLQLKPLASSAAAMQAAGAHTSTATATGAAASTSLGTATTLGGIVLNAKLAAVLVSAIALVTAAFFVLRSPATHEPGALAANPVAPASDERTPLAGEAPLSGVASSRANANEVAPANASTTPKSSAPAAAARKVRGRVLDAEGTPRAGVKLRLHGASEALELSSGGGGWFELTTTLERGEIESDDDSWLTIRSGVFRPEPGSSSIGPLVLVGPWIELEGRVLDETRAGISGAHIALLLPEGFDARFDETLEGTHVLGWDTRAGAQGAFALGRVPNVPGAQLRVVADGYARLLMEAPSASVRGLELTLARPSVPLAGALRGHVVDPRGAPVEGARVAAGLASTLSDAHGEFAIDLARAVTADALVALKQGFLPARLERPKEAREGDSGWPSVIELVLGGPPLSIRGQVVDPKGHPLPGLRVWIDDPTPFGLIGRAAFSQEGLLSGMSVPPQALATEPRAGAKDGDSFWDWTASKAPSTAFWPWITTDDEGRFEIGGLSDRRYKIAVFDPETLARHTSNGIQAGERAAQITVPPAPMWPKVAGVVRSDAGLPLAGVNVELSTEAFGVRSRVFGGRAAFLMLHERESVTTDERGRFEFTNVPKTGINLELSSDDIVPSSHALKPDEDVTALDVRVFTRCRVQVELRPPVARADSIAFTDADGKQLDVLVISTGHVNAYSSVELTDGRSQVAAVSSAARFLLLQRGDEVVERIAIQLAADGVNRLTP